MKVQIIEREQLINAGQGTKIKETQFLCIVSWVRYIVITGKGVGISGVVCEQKVLCNSQSCLLSLRRVPILGNLFTSSLLERVGFIQFHTLNKRGSRDYFGCLILP